MNDITKTEQVTGAVEDEAIDDPIEEIVVDGVIVEPRGKFNILNVKEVVDGVTTSSTVTPSDDLTDKPIEVIEAAELYHTPEIKAKWQANLDSKKPADLPDEVIIAAGIDALSNIVEAAYTTKNWKASEYNAKKIEAEYILSLADVADVDPEKCRLISVEALEKQTPILELATIVIGKVKAYEAMVNGERQTEGLLKTAVEDATTQAEKLAAADAIVAKFKDQVTGG